MWYGLASKAVVVLTGIQSSCGMDWHPKQLLGFEEAWGHGLEGDLLCQYMDSVEVLQDPTGWQEEHQLRVISPGLGAGLEGPLALVDTSYLAS